MPISIIIFLASVAMSTPTALSTTTQLEHKSPQTLNQYVNEYFQETPVLADIAWCESRMRHIDASTGKVIRGTVDSDDTGIMQINTRYHRAEAEKLGLDIKTLSGNLEYAKYLYDKEGTKPWKSSKACWGHLASK